MREIKFRAFCDADDKTGMLYFGMMQFDNGIASWPLPDDISHIDEYLSPLMQYTGLKDKKDKEIYEGDVIRSFYSNGDPCRHLIEYNQSSASFVAKYMEYIDDITNTLFSSISQAWISEHSKEVIGNIYEHPDLLK